MIKNRDPFTLLRSSRLTGTYFVTFLFELNTIVGNRNWNVSVALITTFNHRRLLKEDSIGVAKKENNIAASKKSNYIILLWPIIATPIFYKLLPAKGNELLIYYNCLSLISESPWNYV